MFWCSLIGFNYTNLFKTNYIKSNGKPCKILLMNKQLFYLKWWFRKSRMYVNFFHIFPREISMLDSISWRFTLCALWISKLILRVAVALSRKCVRCRQLGCVNSSDTPDDTSRPTPSIVKLRRSAFPLNSGQPGIGGQFNTGEDRNTK